jgi:tRNA (guanine37-N1)-methyltransferase
MRFSIITAFPDFFRDFLLTSIVGRALRAGLFQVEVVDLRSFGKGAYRQVDDYAFGTGGMVLMARPLEEALDFARRDGKGKKPFVVYPSPQGVPLTQDIVESLFHQEHVVIVCGHYEGIDERFVEQAVDVEVTIGDCVLTGGEIPAMAIIDAVSRLIPGVVGKSGAVAKDSFYEGMLDYPHYTRPASWNGREVSDVLLSGDAAKIEEWRRRQAVTRTLARRPDLLSRCGLRDYLRGGVYVAIEGIFADAERIREWASLCGGYGAVLLLFFAGAPEDREKLRQGLENAGILKPGKVKLFSSFGRLVEWTAEKERQKGPPILVGVCEEDERGGARHWLDLKRFILEEGRPVIFYFPAGSVVDASVANASAPEGTEKKNLDRCDVLMIPLREGPLPLIGKAAAVLDRFLGSR